MALKLYDKIVPSGEFALIDAENVELENGMRLDAFLQALAENAGELDIDYEANLAFDTAEIVVGVTEDTDEPVVPDEPDDGNDSDSSKLDSPIIRLVVEDTDGDGDTPAILGVAILGRTILGQY